MNILHFRKKELYVMACGLDVENFNSIEYQTDDIYSFINHNTVFQDTYKLCEKCETISENIIFL